MAFHPVNTGSVSESQRRQSEAIALAAPRTNTIGPNRPQSQVGAPEASPNSLPKDKFGGLAGQRPLPSSTSLTNPASALPQSDQNRLEGMPSRGNSLRSTRSGGSGHPTVDPEDSDEGQDASENESVAGDIARPAKKKKGQRFFCTEFPPCNLSFTRSEHLARHIRKHTGERPFQCHCARRFSRLDNLRQHAQTVHVNEDIPGDSLAATGTRFQRQIRTDRVRPPGSRSRATTLGSHPGPSRGHSRTLSASSVASTVSTTSQRDDGRRQPPPLMMANDPTARARLTLDTFRIPPEISGQQFTGYSANSPGSFSTPTSAHFSTGPGSPLFTPGLQSPISTIPRNPGVWAQRTPNRRLSVPSGVNSYTSPHGATYQPPYLSPLASSTASIYTPDGSSFGSPTSSTFSARRETVTSADAEWRRRTWHPETYTGSYNRPAPRGTGYYQTPDNPEAAMASQVSASQTSATRLPGIESFDRVSYRPLTPPERGTSPMQLDTPSRLASVAGPTEQSGVGPDDKRGHVQWDMSLHHNLTKLDITSSGQEPHVWGQSLSRPPNGSTSRPSTAPQPPMYPDTRLSHTQPIQYQSIEVQQSSNGSPETPRRIKRQGWYNGPLSATQPTFSAQRTSPEDSSSSEGVPTPSISSAGEYHPSIVHSNGYIEANHSTVGPEDSHASYTNKNGNTVSYPLPSERGTRMDIVEEPSRRKRDDADMGRLEALVAVATSETKP
ncbi:hypothetical protein L228DRAFT_239701 [Xylona heveae TC161]|uniref:C2H2-type domain-containing protein n=1 Tax=Xylona heveae (strain CBS 132557 / TC161) TaxID=1328760 RepID=A0A165G5B2_XYLHT|nr:hypothetical protein L228DRAFT_239701 [Xylona heveae TC161]KZF21755.1 hypothetical protein L228DRAFT_239701 [Xylona heveae TC161]